MSPARRGFSPDADSRHRTCGRGSRSPRRGCRGPNGWSWPVTPETPAPPLTLTLSPQTGRGGLQRWRLPLPVLHGERVRVRGGAAVDGAGMGGPTLRNHCPRSSLSRKRWILPVAVFGNAGTNLTERGYL